MEIFKKRLMKIKEMLFKESISSFLISDNINCEYVSGLRSSNQFLLIKKEKQYLITDFRYRQVAMDISHKNGFVYTEIDSEGLGATLSNLLDKEDILGIESDNLTVDQFDKIVKVLDNVSIKKYANIIPELICFKSEEEIYKIKTAAKCGDEAFLKFINDITTGITEKEAAKKLESFCLNAGSEGPSFNTIVLFGDRSALPHGTPSDRKLKVGDYVLCDFGCIIDGYCSDMTRTFIYGNKNEEQSEIYNIVNNARAEAIAFVKAGVKASEVDNIARDYISTHGYGDKFGHGTGHGVGREVHEFPAVNSRNDTILKEGMIITIEPGIYIEDHGGVRIEDMVLVKESGAELITGFSRDLIEIEEGSEI